MNPGRGVYFRPEDYASFWKRAFVDAVDVVVFGVSCLALTVLILVILPLNRPTLNLLFLIWIAIAFAYFVALKSTGAK